MGRKRVYERYKHPYSLVTMVEAIVADYPRRERVIKYSSEDEAIITEYSRINSIIDEMVNVLESELAEIIKDDIVNRVGYERSRAALFAAKKTYYRRKSMLIHDIAKGLLLIS